MAAVTAREPGTESGTDGIAEFADELRLLAETVLERVEPVLRYAAAEDRPEWNSCEWCPVCAATALVRGERHEVLATVAEHGTAIVTVLREALAGVPVDPVMPEDTSQGTCAEHGWPGPAEHGEPAHEGGESGTSSSTTAKSHDAEDNTDADGRDRTRQRRRFKRAGRRRAEATEAAATSADAPEQDRSTEDADADTEPGPSATEPGERKRARYVGIPVNIKT